MIRDDLFDCPWNAGRSDARDHRDDGQPGRGVTFAVPAGILLWLMSIAVGALITWAVIA